MTSPVQLSLAAAAVAPGDQLAAAVTVHGDDARGVTVELLYDDEYTYNGESSPSGSGPNSSLLELAIDTGVAASSGPQETTSAEVVVVTQQLPAAADGGFAGTHELLLALPADAPPSAGALIRWRLRATVDRAVGGSDFAETDVLVASTPANSVTGELTERPIGDDQLQIIVAGGVRAVRAGEAFTGTLVVTAKKSAKFTELRVGLRSTRKDQGIVLHSTVASVTVADKLSLEAGERHEAQFSLTVPADALPSFSAQYNRVDHELEASAARRMKLDFNTTLDVYVASAEPGRGVG